MKWIFQKDPIQRLQRGLEIPLEPFFSINKNWKGEKNQNPCKKSNPKIGALSVVGFLIIFD